MSADKDMDDIDELMPLHASGLLTPRERQRIESAMASDPGKRRRFARILAEREALIEANETIAPPKAALSKLMASLDAAPQMHGAKQSARRARFVDALRAFFEPSFAMTAIAALALAMLLGGALSYSFFGRQAGYEMAGGDTQAAKGPTALVIFTGDVKLAALQDALKRAGASIISGPKGEGFFELRFDDNPALRPVDERMRELAESTDVIRSLTISGE